jgi:hypothetical protein
MFGKWYRKGLYKTSQLLSVIVLARTSLAVLVELVEPWRKSSVLFNILLHDSFDHSDVFDVWEEYCFFGIMMVMHTLAPALAVD